VLSGAGKKSGVGAAAQWNVKFECPANADLFPFISGSSTLGSLYSYRNFLCDFSLVGRNNFKLG